MDQIEVGGLRIAYRRAGVGPPVVLLHGGPLRRGPQIPEVGAELRLWPGPALWRGPDPGCWPRLSEFTIPCRRGLPRNTLG